jgi:dephospho-CoA kinase
MLSVGLTGGIGTGKSTVAKVFACLGVPVLNTDALAKQLINTNAQLQQQLIASFGNDIFAEEKLQNKILAAKAFATKEQTALLNSIVHPFVFAAIDQWNAKQNAPYTMRESALLIETKSYQNIDVIIGVVCLMSIRLERIMQRDACTLAEAQQRINRQMNEEEKCKYYHYSINNYPPHFITKQVLALHQQLLQQAAAL